MKVTHNGKQYHASKLNENEWQLSSVDKTSRENHNEPLADAHCRVIAAGGG